jgi:ABC-type uncharacterized transport system permease subunit
VTPEHISSNLALLGYAFAALLYLVGVGKTRRNDGTGNIALAVFTAATLSASYTVISQLQSEQPTMLSGLLLAVAISWLAILGHVKFKLRLIGAFVAPLATLIVLMQFFVTPGHPIATDDGTGSSLLLTLHVTMAILGQAFAILACAVSVFYLWQQNLLKKKLLSQLPQNLPAIDRIDKLLRLCLWTGYVFITLGLLSGAIYTQLYAPPSSWMLSAKVVWATVVWLWYLATLLAQNIFNRPSKRIAQMCLAGFLLMALSYFGMGFFLTGGP